MACHGVQTRVEEVQERGKRVQKHLLLGTRSGRANGIAFLSSGLRIHSGLGTTRLPPTVTLRQSGATNTED